MKKKNVIGRRVRGLKINMKEARKYLMEAKLFGRHNARIESAYLQEAVRELKDVELDAKDLIEEISKEIIEG